MQSVASDPNMERPASRGRGSSMLVDRRVTEGSDDEEVSRAESYHSRRSHTTTGGTGHSRLMGLVIRIFKNDFKNICLSRHNSSNCINVYSSYTTDPLQTASGADIDPGGQPHVRRSASGVFRYPTAEDSENQFSDHLYLLENGCNRHGPIGVMPEYAVEDVYHDPKDPFNG